MVATGRKIVGATNPLASEPGTIRGDFAIDVGRNIIHGSDSVESAKREIGLWFKQDELADFHPTIKPWCVPVYALGHCLIVGGPLSQLCGAGCMSKL